jgi:hypothetical protein
MAGGNRVHDRGMSERSARMVLAPILFTAVAVEVLIAVGAGIASDRSWTFLMNHFVVTNAVIGGSLAVAGSAAQSDRLAAAGRWRVLRGLGCRVLIAGLGIALR